MWKVLVEKFILLLYLKLIDLVVLVRNEKYRIKE